jgi:hypothetical protein
MAAYMRGSMSSIGLGGDDDDDGDCIKMDVCECS